MSAKSKHTSLSDEKFSKKCPCIISGRRCTRKRLCDHARNSASGDLDMEVMNHRACLLAKRYGYDGFTVPGEEADAARRLAELSVCRACLVAGRATEVREEILAQNAEQYQRIVDRGVHPRWYAREFGFGGVEGGKLVNGMLDKGKGRATESRSSEPSETVVLEQSTSARREPAQDVASPPSVESTERASNFSKMNVFEGLSSGVAAPATPSAQRVSQSSHWKQGINRPHSESMTVQVGGAMPAFNATIEKPVVNAAREALMQRRLDTLDARIRDLENETRRLKDQLATVNHKSSSWCTKLLYFLVGMLALIVGWVIWVVRMA